MKVTTDGARKLRWFLLRRGDKVSAAAVGTGFLLFLIASLMLPFGRLAEPGAGLWPTLISALGLLFAILLFIFGNDIPVLARDQRGVRLGLYLAAIVLYAPIYSLVGFIPASVIVLFALIKVAGGFSWVMSTVTSVVGAVAVYALFALALSLPIDAF